MWHYTTAEGLIAILQSGKMFSTQVTCLNDSLEQRYSGDLVYDAAKLLLSSNKDPDFAIFLKIAEDTLIRRDFSTAYISLPVLAKTATISVSGVAMVAVIVATPSVSG